MATTIKLRRTEKTLSQIQNQTIDYGEAIVSPENNYIVIGKKNKNKVQDAAVILNVGVPIPFLQDGTTYAQTGTTIHPVILNNYSEYVITNPQSPSGRNVGSYTITFSLNTNKYRGIKWYDGTSEDKIITWEIVPALSQKVEQAVFAETASGLNPTPKVDGCEFDAQNNVVRYIQVTDPASDIINCSFLDSSVPRFNLNIGFTKTVSNAQGISLKIKGKNDTTPKTYGLYLYSNKPFTSAYSGQVISVVNVGTPPAGSGLNGLLKVCGAAYDKQIQELQNNKTKCVVQTSSPSSAQIGDLWVNPSTNVLYYYNGTSWVQITNTKSTWQ